MRRLTCFEVLALYTLSAAACASAREQAANGGKEPGGDSNTIRSDAGGVAQRADSSAPSAVSGRDATANAAQGPGGNSGTIRSAVDSGQNQNPDGLCHGTANGGYIGVGPPGSAQVPRAVAVACYVATSAAGNLHCLPASDPDLVSRLQDANHSCAFIAEFVIEATADVALPASCDTLLVCCNSATNSEPWKKMSCEDTADNLAGIDHQYRGGVCPFTTSQFCGDAGSAMIGDADGGDEADSTRYGLCCYQTCGHPYCI